MKYELDNETFLAACRAYGECIDFEGCVEETTMFLMTTFGMSEEAALDMAVAAKKEWAEAYE